MTPHPQPFNTALTAITTGNRQISTHTPARQPQEYIVTLDELQKLMSWSTHKSPAVCQYERRLEILKRVQSRPHTSPQAPATIIGKQTHQAFESAKFPVFVQGTGWISNTMPRGLFAETAAKAEREQVLDALEEFLNSDDHLSLFKWEVREQIRALRDGGAP